MTQTPTITQEPQQRMRALERANEVRLKRAELKRQIADGHLTAADVILDLPDEARNWSVGELLKSQRRWGSIRSHKMLAGMHISEKRPIGDLTMRQRRLIADGLAMHAAREHAPHRTLEGPNTADVAVREARELAVSGTIALEVDEARDLEMLEAPDVDFRESRELAMVGA